MSQGNQGANQQQRGQAGGQQAPAGQGGNYGRQPRGQYAGGPGGPGTDLAGPVKLGLATFLAIGFGVSITLFLFVTLVPGTGGTGGFGTPSTLGLFGGAAQLTGALIFGFVMVVMAGPVVATGLGGYIGAQATPGESPALAGAASSAIGAAVTMIVLVVLAILFAPGPGGAGGLGQLIGPLIGAIVGIALTGAAGGAIGQKLS